MRIVGYWVVKAMRISQSVYGAAASLMALQPDQGELTVLRPKTRKMALVVVIVVVRTEV